MCRCYSLSAENYILHNYKLISISQVALITVAIKAISARDLSYNK